MQVFSLVISLVTIGSVVVTINSKLLGGKVSFFQSLCVLGYALAPLLLASIVALLLHNLFVRVPVSLVCFGWSVWGQSSFLYRRPKLTCSVDELLQRDRSPRLANTAGSVPAVPVLLRPVLDDHDPIDCFFSKRRGHAFLILYTGLGSKCGFVYQSRSPLINP